MKLWRWVMFIAALMVSLCGALRLHKVNAQTTGAVAAAQKPLYARLRWKRAAPSDLEISGDLTGTPAHGSRYASREQLLALPQVNYTVTNDANFKGPTEISGVALDELLQGLTENPQTELAIAICSDKYEAHYPRDYMTAHKPVLVLKINGKGPADWPKFSTGADMGPYLISSADFKPSFKILSHEDEPQIPWGVVRLEIRKEDIVFNAIRPSGPGANSSDVQDGYRIAQQNCFRCHNTGDEGGTKAQRPWVVLSMWATASPDNFAAYIHDPKSRNPKSEMPGFPNYDAATLRALTRYFQSFNEDTKGKKP